MRILALMVLIAAPVVMSQSFSMEIVKKMLKDGKLEDVTPEMEMKHDALMLEQCKITSPNLF